MLVLESLILGTSIVEQQTGFSRFSFLSNDRRSIARVSPFRLLVLVESKHHLLDVSKDFIFPPRRPVGDSEQI